MTEDYLIEKILSRNDVGETGSHQAGIAIPKSLVPYFPRLDPSQNNPDTYIEVEAPNETKHLWRYIHYNNSLHSSTGTRNEFRITRLSSFFRQFPRVRSGDILRIQFTDGNHSIGEVIPGNHPPSSGPVRLQNRAGADQKRIPRLINSKKAKSATRPVEPAARETEQDEVIIRKGTWRVARART